MCRRLADKQPQAVSQQRQHVYQQESPRNRAITLRNQAGQANRIGKHHCDEENCDRDCRTHPAWHLNASFCKRLIEPLVDTVDQRRPCFDEGAKQYDWKQINQKLCAAR